MILLCERDVIMNNKSYKLKELDVILMVVCMGIGAFLGLLAYTQNWLG